MLWGQRSTWGHLDTPKAGRVRVVSTTHGSSSYFVCLFVFSWFVLSYLALLFFFCLFCFSFFTFCLIFIYFVLFVCFLFVCLFVCLLGCLFVCWVIVCFRWSLMMCQLHLGIIHFCANIAKECNQQVHFIQGWYYYSLHNRENPLYLGLLQELVKFDSFFK